MQRSPRLFEMLMLLDVLVDAAELGECSRVVELLRCAYVHTLALGLRLTLCCD